MFEINSWILHIQGGPRLNLNKPLTFMHWSWSKNDRSHKKIDESWILKGFNNSSETIYKHGSYILLTSESYLNRKTVTFKKSFFFFKITIVGNLEPYIHPATGCDIYAGKSFWANCFCFKTNMRLLSKGD